MMRAAAILLLCFMCLDLCLDLVYGETGDTEVQDPVMAAAASAPGSSSTLLTASGASALPESGHGSLHECFCCCSHLEEPVPAELAMELLTSAATREMDHPSPDPDILPLYPPPQAV